MGRRTVLRAVGVGVTVGFAGCAGSGNDESAEPENDGDRSGETTPDSTSTTTAESTETGSSTPNQTPVSEFSTEGDDSTIINAPPEDLVVTADAVPKEGYSLSKTQSGDEGKCSHFSRLGQSQDGGANIRIRADVCDSVSTAKRAFGALDYSALVGASPDESEKLAIAVESTYSIGTHSSGSGSFIKFRDANAVGSILWTTDGDPIQKQTIGELAVTMHQSWR